MSDIGKGDFVEFYQTWRGRPIPPGCNIVLGRVYRVARLAMCDAVAGGPAIVPGAALDGVRWNGVEPCIPLDCLRPVYRPKRSLIDSLKKKARKRIEVSHEQDA